MSAWTEQVCHEGSETFQGQPKGCARIGLEVGLGQVDLSRLLG